jgi:hypothetical protein
MNRRTRAIKLEDQPVTRAVVEFTIAPDSGCIASAWPRVRRKALMCTSVVILRRRDRSAGMRASILPRKLIALSTAGALV